MSDIEALIRPHLRGFKPYAGRVAASAIVLDANELAGKSPLTDADGPINRYPDPSYAALRAALGARVGLGAAETFVATGSDEVIDLMIRLLCEPGRDNIAAISPSFGMYRTWAEISGVACREVALDGEMQLDLAAARSAIDADTKLVFCCSPNNPTGNALRGEAMLALAEMTRGLLVVDHAYIEFAEGGDLTASVGKIPNLVVLRTLSKAWGLAGLRVGYALGPATLVAYLNAIRAPYHVSHPAQDLALSALERRDFAAREAAAVRARRADLAAKLDRLACVRRVYPSDANFLLVEFGDAARAHAALLAASISVRARDEARLKDCLRITVGSEDENRRVIDVLKAVPR